MKPDPCFITLLQAAAFAQHDLETCDVIDSVQLNSTSVGVQFGSSFRSYRFKKVQVQPEVVHCGVHCLPVLTASSSTQTDDIDWCFASEVVEWNDFSAGLHCASPSSRGSDYDCDSDSLNTSSESIDSTCSSQSTGTSRLGLVYTAQLQRLLRFCPSCGQPNLSEHTQITNVGTMLKVVTECLAGCTFTWHSQETLSAAHAGGVPKGNFALASACLLSGSTYAVLSRICSTIGLPLMCESTYCQYLSKYTMPCIFDAYNLMQTCVINELKEKESVILCGDMRCDSPGFSAKYGTYSFTDAATGYVVAFRVVQLGMEAASSVGMERVGFESVLRFLLNLDVKVKVVAIDRSATVIKC